MDLLQQVHDAHLSDQILVGCSAQHQLLSQKSHFCLDVDREMNPRKASTLLPSQLPLHRASWSLDLSVVELQKFGLILQKIQR